jgi:hypothetical protein
MDAARPLVAVETTSLAWVEICKRYPDQFVCLVDAIPVELRNPKIVSGRVVGHGPTRTAAFAHIRDDLPYAEWTVVFTGRSRKPLRRPPVICD